MSASCADFRALLEQALASRPRLAELARAEHPQTCALCRAELGRERALDDLLERVPEPEVPAALARAVLAGLAAERVRTASSDSDPDTGDVTAEDAALEELLDGLPAPRIPAGLPARVLAGVAHARPRRPPRRRGPWLLLAAAGLAGLVLWAWNARRAGSPLEVAQSGEAELDAELLAYAVERWELLHDEDLDVWLASLDPIDEVLLEFAGDATLSDATSEAPRKGNPAEGD